MILLDTNIISETMRPNPNSQVLNWFDQQKSADLFISVITVAEIEYGLNVLPEGKRRRQVEEFFEKAILRSFQHRILDFDFDAARFYAKIMARRKLAGRPLSIPDGQIAAIACSQGMSLVTRNEKDFADCDLEIINPFD